MFALPPTCRAWLLPLLLLAAAPLPLLAAALAPRGDEPVVLVMPPGQDPLAALQRLPAQWRLVRLPEAGRSPATLHLAPALPGDATDLARLRAESGAWLVLRAAALGGCLSLPSLPKG